MPSIISSVSLGVRGLTLAAAVVGSAGLFDASTGTSSARAPLLRPVAPLAPVVDAAAGPLGQFTSCVWSNGGTTYDLSSMTVTGQGALPLRSAQGGSALLLPCAAAATSRRIAFSMLPSPPSPRCAQATR